jgi:hypothetical protein
MIDDAVFRRIKKCLALSQSPEPHEAATALHQAQRLMEKYNVTMKMVERADITNKSVEAKGVSRVKRWEYLLAVSIIGRSFGCKVSWVEGRSGISFGRFNFLGQKNQVELCVYAFSVLHRQILKDRGAFVKTLPMSLSRKQVTEKADSFCEGWLHAVNKTVIDFVQPPEVLKLIDEMYNEKAGGKAQHRHQASDLDHDAWCAGSARGKEAALHRPVNAAEERLKLENQSV